MTSATHIRHLPDSGYTVEAIVNEYHADFKVYEIVSYARDGTTPTMWGGCTDDFTEILADAPVFLSGYVKWDHCSNWEFNQKECMLHFCSGEALLAVGTLMKACFDLAAELVPTWDKQ